MSTHTVVGPGTTTVLSHRVTYGSTLSVLGGGTAVVASALSNAGLTEVYGSGGSGGVLDVGGTLTNTGTILVDAGTGSGDGGLLSVTGVLLDLGRIDIAGGTGSAAGTLLIAAGASLTVENSPGRVLYGGLTIEGVATNEGVVTVEANGTGQGPSMSVTGTFTNDGTLDVLAGTQKGTGGEVKLISGVHGDGTIHLYGGRHGDAFLRLDGRKASTQGALIIDGGDATKGGSTNGGASAVVDGTLTLTSMLDVGGDSGAGAGTLTIDGTVTVAPSVAGARAVAQLDGVLVDNGALILGKSTSAPADATLNGTLDDNRYFGLRGSTMTVDGLVNGVGSLTEKYGSSLIVAQGGTISGVNLYVDQSTLVVSGVVVANFSNYGSGSLQVTSTGTVELSGSLSNQFVVNDGLIEGTGTIRSSTVTGMGTIAATPGTLVVSASVEGREVLEARGGSVLQLPADVSQDVAFRIDPGGTIQASIYNAGNRVRSFDGGTLALTSGGTATLAAGDTHLTVLLGDPSNLTLGPLGFINVVGSSGSDTITAMSSGQTLSGGPGLDLLMGAAATGDTFLDTAAGLNFDTIGNFAGSDAIDVTDLAFASTTLSYNPGFHRGALRLSDGHEATTITLLGSFTAGSFVLTDDGSGGAKVTLHS